MRVGIAVGVFLSASAIALGQDMTITGTVRNLDGVPLRSLNNFTVQAFSAGRLIASGTITKVPPFVYNISIPANQVSSTDVRVLLAYRATGRDPVDIERVAGKASTGEPPVAVNSSQTIDIVMPEAQVFVDCEFYDCKPRSRWRLFGWKR